MITHETMDTFTFEWVICIAIVSTTVYLLVNLPNYFWWAKNPNYPKFLGGALLINLLIENAYSWWLGNWHLQDNLPLHLCGISGVFAIILLFRYNAILANLLFYWGTTGGIHSLLTPEFDLGAQGYFYYGYFISHGGLIMTTFFIIQHNNYKPDKQSWLRAFMLIQLAVLAIGAFDWATGSNYMYLLAPPIVENPLIVGKWPWYILVFEGLAMVHFLLLYGIFHWKTLFKKPANLLTIW